MSDNSAIITLAQSVSVRLDRLWWPLRTGLFGQVARLLWDLANRLARADATAIRANDLERMLLDARKMQRETAQAYGELLRQRDELLQLVDHQDAVIAQRGGELYAERERCARLVLQMGGRS